MSLLITATAAITAGLVTSLPLATSTPATSTPATSNRAARLDARILSSWKVSSSSTDPAILHCVRKGEIVPPAHIVQPGERKTFACHYRIGSGDDPYGVMVWQPRDREVRVTYAGIPLRTVAPQSFGGRDVWADKGNPGGRHTIRIR